MSLSPQTVSLTRADLKDITNKTFQILDAEQHLKPKRSVLRDHVAQLLAKRQWSSLMSDWPDNQTRKFAIPQLLTEEWDLNNMDRMSTIFAVDTLQTFAKLPDLCKRYEFVPPELMKLYIWENLGGASNYYQGFFLGDAVNDEEWEQFHKGLSHWPLVLDYEGELWLVMEIFQLNCEQTVLIAPDIKCGHYAMRLDDYLEFKTRYLAKHSTPLGKWEEKKFNIEAMQLIVKYSATLTSHT